MARRTDPFGDIEDILDAMTGQLGGRGAPPVDVADTGEAFVAVVDLPGYDAGSLDVKLTDPTTLYVGAGRETDRVEEADRYVVRERGRESVSRTVTLPEPVDEAETNADFENGVLTVTLPKRTKPDDEGTDIPVN